MSSSEQEDSEAHSEAHQVVEDADENTLRIMVSTDNHLGYAEGDTVRGCDSFAALEEVLYLAKHYQADMVLLAGDLFHENKPSRRTLHKTMDLFRRYCLGPNPVPIQILSDQSQNFRRGLVNYEDENYSVDLPVFSIHGNHDDPTREGTDLLAALDLLDVANLVNYVGRQEQVNQVEISPILIKKGETHLALYGLGSMRDERLNRMWSSQKVSFLRPEEEEGEKEWFNLFALHQNRDLGRGTKNCIHESMIPEWMDLVVWGHEHECNIEAQESVVGTFRITQPGSSVATSLTAGEAERKQIGILDIRGQQFRLLPIPLTQVRSFVIGDLSLANQRRLDPEDPKVEQKVSRILEEQTRVLIHDAREKMQELKEAAKGAGNPIALMEDCPLKNVIDKPEEVLVRLKVDHSGFSALNNQRFGAKFIGEVGNPTDILLFSRKKQEKTLSPSSKKIKGVQPIAPEELEEMNIEDLIVGELEQPDRKLELFDEKRVSDALTDYVTKQEAQAIGEAVSNLLGKQQKKLIQRGPDSLDQQNDEDNEENEDPRGSAKTSGKRSRSYNVGEHEDEMDDKSLPRGGNHANSSKRAAKKTVPLKIADDDYSEDEDEEVTPSRRTTSKRAQRARRGRKVLSYNEEGSDYDIEAVAPPANSMRARATKRSASTRTRSRRKNYKMSHSESDDDAIVIVDNESDDSPPPKNKKSRASARSSKARSTPPSSQKMSQSQLSFAPVSRSNRRTATRKKAYADDGSDDDDMSPTRTFEIDDDWGTAKTNTYKSR